MPHSNTLTKEQEFEAGTATSEDFAHSTRKGGQTIQPTTQPTQDQSNSTQAKNRGTTQ